MPDGVLCTCADTRAYFKNKMQALHDDEWIINCHATLPVSLLLFIIFEVILRSIRNRHICCDVYLSTVIASRWINAHLINHSLRYFGLGLFICDTDSQYFVGIVSDSHPFYPMDTFMIGELGLNVKLWIRNTDSVFSIKNSDLYYILLKPLPLLHMLVHEPCLVRFV